LSNYDLGDFYVETFTIVNISPTEYRNDGINLIFVTWKCLAFNANIISKALYLLYQFFHVFDVMNPLIFNTSSILGNKKRETFSQNWLKQSNAFQAILYKNSWFTKFLIQNINFFDKKSWNFIEFSDHFPYHSWINSIILHYEKIDLIAV